MQEYISQQDRKAHANARSVVSRKASKTALVDQRPQQELMQRKAAIQRNRTGLPDQLKSGMEQLSGYNLDHVRVHYNSAKPAAVQAHAYAQEGDIHLAQGQEKHLPHELGHVVQQMQGRVQPTTSVAGMAVNDNPGLESEADRMGTIALQRKENRGLLPMNGNKPALQLIQREEKPQELKIVGKTHWVKPKGHSIYEGEEGDLIDKTTRIYKAPGTIYKSRRGPHQEVFSDWDKNGEKIYRWIPVKIGSPQSNNIVYLREDVLVNKNNESKENLQKDFNDKKTEFENKIAEYKAYPSPAKLLRAESILAFASCAGKLVAGIAFSIIGAINGLVGQFTSAAGSFIVGFFKYCRYKKMQEKSNIINLLIDHYTNKLSLYLNINDQGVSDNNKLLGDADEKGKEKEIVKLDETINIYRLFESVADLLTSFGGVISGSIMALFGLVPKVGKVLRSIGQWKGKVKPNLAGKLIMLEAFLSGIISIINIEEMFRVAAGGEKIEAIYEGVIKPDKQESSIAEAGKSAALTLGLETSAVKGYRGSRTPLSGMSKDRQEQLKKTKRMRKKAFREQVGKAKELKSTAKVSD